MGCDIHSFVEKKNSAGSWERVTWPNAGETGPWGWRSYRIFGFLANVRNYSDSPFISNSRGMPEGVSPSVAKEYETWDSDGHSHSWLSLKELLAFNYDSEMEDRRYTRQIGPNSWDGAATCERGMGKKTTFREFLDGGFFTDLAALESLGSPDEIRVVFWFDN